MVKFSVIITGYDNENYFKKCLDSVLNQTLNDFEVICITAGFTGYSLNILKDYQMKDERVIATHTPIDINTGTDLANGEYIFFVNPDDWLELNALEKLYDNAKTNGSDIVLFNSKEIYSSKTVNNIYFSLDESIDYNNFTFDYTYKKSLVLNSGFEISRKIFKNSFLKENNIQFQNPEIFNEIMFHVKSIIFAEKISYHPEILYYHNKLNLNMIQNKEESEYNERLAIFDIFEEIKEFIMSLNLWDELYINFYEFYINELEISLKKSSKEFKEEFYNRVRLEFLNMKLDYEILNKMDLDSYKFYVQVINNEKFTQFGNLKNKEKDNYINKKELSKEIKNFNDCGINTSNRKESIIVSLTSFPERMYDISFCLYSLLNQSLKPDKVILWLADSQFPNKEKDIPEDVLNLKKNGLTIKWCEDIRSYKKIIPALKEYPDSFIVTADDDIFYPENWLKDMWDAYQQYPNTLIASRVRKIEFNYDKTLRRYTNWSFPDDFSISYCNFSTNGAGTLFFPNSLSHLATDDSLFLELCPSCDDVWIWAMAVLNKTEITSIGNPLKKLTYVNILREINANDEFTLWKDNYEGINDISINNILEQFPEIMEIINQNGDING